MKEFDALFLMTTAIRSSFMVLGWTIILLFVCQMPTGETWDLEDNTTIIHIVMMLYSYII